MSDRKYRQRGYQDDKRDREQTSGTIPSTPREKPEGPKTPNLMAFRNVVRCARCGNVIAAVIETGSRCGRCGADLHACAQCAFFDTGSRFECTQPIPARVAPKDARNGCTSFDARMTVERETHSTAPSNARSAFDDLFK